jgi:hypothetical protein
MSMNLYVLPHPNPNTIARVIYSETSPGSDWIRMSEEEFNEWRNAQPPLPSQQVSSEPDWKLFKRTLLADLEINQLLGNGISLAPAAAISLPTTLINSSEGGDLSDFRAAWLALRRSGLVSQQLLHKVRYLAIQCNMPESFLASIGGTTRPAAEFVGQEWISSEGNLWVVVQARGENGQFLPDDPNTPEKESLIWIQVE